MDKNKTYETYRQKASRLLSYEKGDTRYPEHNSYSIKEHTSLIKQKVKAEQNLRKAYGEQEASALVAQTNEDLGLQSKRIDERQAADTPDKFSMAGMGFTEYGNWNADKESKEAVADGQLTVQGKREVIRKTRFQLEKAEHNPINRIANKLFQRD